VNCYVRTSAVTYNKPHSARAISTGSLLIKTKRKRRKIPSSALCYARLKLKTRAVPRLCELCPGICLTTDETALKNLSQHGRTPFNTEKPSVKIKKPQSSTKNPQASTEKPQ
jgi:hypothetical protein